MVVPNLTKKLIAEKKDQGVIECFKFDLQEQETRFIVEKIIQLRKVNPNISWNDFAVLVRTNNQADIFIETFIKHGIPCQFIGSKGLFSSSEILDLISYLKLLANPDDSKAFYRVLKMDIFNFSPLLIAKILNFAKQKNFSLFEVLNFFSNEPFLVDKNALKSIEKLLEMIKTHLKMSQEKTVGQVLYKFLEDSKILEKLIKEETKENSEKLFKINQFFKKIEKFEKESKEKTVKEFIEEIDLIIESGEDSFSLNLENGPEAVKIMTVHSAKGLEFENVFLVNLIDQRFPCSSKKEEIEILPQLIKEIIPEGDLRLEEERRLFYVGCTRAKKRLFFTWAEDYGGLRKRKPSRFLEEIDILSNQCSKILNSRILGSHSLTKITEIQDLASKIVETQNLASLPKKFSYTQLKAFSTCPRQYKYSHILSIPRQPSHALSYGKTIHNTLKEFYSFLIEKKEMTEESLLKIYQKNFIPDFYESKEHLEKRKIEGEKNLKNFYQKENFSQLPSFLERSFNLRIENYTLQGRIDRIDLLEKDKVEIIDYKTGQAPKEKKDREQLFLYALAVEDVFNLKPVLLSYYYIDQGEKISFSPDKEEIKKTKEWAIKIIEEILKSDFSPISGWHCQFCDFKGICEERA